MTWLQYAAIIWALVSIGGVGFTILNDWPWFRGGGRYTHNDWALLTGALVLGPVFWVILSILWAYAFKKEGLEL